MYMNKYNEEAKTLRKETQKLSLDRQRVIRNFHGAFVKEKNDSLYLYRTHSHSPQLLTHYHSFNALLVTRAAAGFSHLYSKAL